MRLAEFLNRYRRIVRRKQYRSFRTGSGMDTHGIRHAASGEGGRLEFCPVTLVIFHDAGRITTETNAVNDAASWLGLERAGGQAVVNAADGNLTQPTARRVRRILNRANRQAEQ